MSKAIVIHATGGPEVLHYEERAVDAPAAGQVRVRHTAIGLNYIDVYFRNGLYQGPVLPFVPGMEAAGVVQAVGDGVESLEVGDRIAYATPPVGAYAEERVIAADRVVELPESIDDTTAAAMMLQGMTVEYLLERTYKVRAGDTILVHAAAGGIGLLACQWAKHLGATVIGTVGSDRKAELARASGCDHTIVYTREDFVQKVREITAGVGVPVVYDGVGKDTFLRSLDCLRPLGMMVLFGNASGTVEPFDPGLLSQKGSLYVTRPTLMTYTAREADLRASAARVFQMVGSKAVRININQTFPLADAAEAHRALEERRTTGSTVLLP